VPAGRQCRRLTRTRGRSGPLPRPPDLPRPFRQPLVSCGTWPGRPGPC
jgi:hypothetical protein